MKDLQRIGDGLYFRGELVAILVESGVTASLMGDFTDALEDSFQLNMDAKDVEKTAEEYPYDTALDDLQRNIKPFAKGGLIKQTDLARICEQLKEEVGKE